MCAILGWSGRITPALLRALYRNAIPHGPHSVGLATFNGTGVEVFKRAVHPRLFLRNHSRRINRAATFTRGFGHVRFATHGSKTDENAHPFTHDGIVFCHNGVIHNYKKLMPEAVVDSECLGPLIARRDLSPSNGSTGAVWFEHGRLFAYRHWQRLSAVTFVMDPDLDEALTLVVTNINMIPRTLSYYARTVHALQEGVAYEILPNGPLQAWHNPNKLITTSGSLWCSPELAAV